MKHCPSCGREVDDRLMNCPACGGRWDADGGFSLPRARRMASPASVLGAALRRRRRVALIAGIALFDLMVVVALLLMFASR